MKISIVCTSCRSVKTELFYEFICEGWTGIEKNADVDDIKHIIDTGIKPLVSIHFKTFNDMVTAPGKSIVNFEIMKSFSILKFESCVMK